MLGNSALSYRLPKDASPETILRKSAFFSVKMGLRVMGAHVMGIVPMYRLISMENLVAGLEAAHTRHGRQPWGESIASRTFFLFEHNISRITETLQEIQSLSLSPRIVCTAEDAKTLLYNGIPSCSILQEDCVLVSKDVLLLVYSSTLSEKSLAQLCSVFSTSADAETKTISLLGRATRNLKFPVTSASFCTAEYNGLLKPWSQSVLDAVFYMDKWGFLTEEEQMLRCISSIFLFPIVIPITCLLLSKQHSSYKPEYSNLMRWQRSGYKKAVRSYILENLDPCNYDMKKPILDVIAVPALIELGYLNADQLPTERGNYVSPLHNLMGLAQLSDVPKHAANLRIMFMLSTLAAAVLSTSYLVGLLLHARFVHILSTMSYAAVAIAFVTVALDVINRGSSKDKRNILPVCLTVLPYSAIMFGVGVAFGNSVPLLVRTFCCAATVVACLVYATASISMSVLYQQDVQMSQKLGLSITSYLEAKPTIVKTFEDLIIVDKTQLPAYSYIHALKVGHGNVDLLFSGGDTTASIHDDHPQPSTGAIVAPPTPTMTYPQLTQPHGENTTRVL